MKKMVRTIKQFIKEKPIRNHLSIFDDDIFLVSYPRSGNTWVRFLLGTLITGEKMNWENMETGIPDIYRNTDKQLLKIKRPRFIKSHNSYDERYKKVVYLVRDVRDVIISYYNFHLKFKQKNDRVESSDDFIEKFINGDLDDFGTWKVNVSGWLSNKDKITNGFHLTKYEDLKNNTLNEINKILSFIEFNKTNKEIREAIEWSSFNNMKKMERIQQDVKLFKNSDKSYDFMRSGKTGDWKDIFTVAQIKKINDEYDEILIELGYNT